MSTIRSKASHEERTASEPRDPNLHRVRIDRIKDVNSTTKLIKLSLKENKQNMFLPGQWLDVFVPGTPKAGGFTITSEPARTSPKPPQTGFLELAIQKSPNNPPAAWLWRPVDETRGTELNVRVGGSFVWPPSNVPLEDIDRAIFIAGGASAGERILFLDRLISATLSPAQSMLVDHVPSEFRLKLFLTGQTSNVEQLNDGDSKPLRQQMEREAVDVAFRRLTVNDALDVLGPEQNRAKTVCYVCGPPAMTDEYVKVLREQKGMDEGRVMCEKWW
ncbi:uncharacterized protein K452DRAFT_249747 [Aplosporella prunicola CBS 121167]|uniref:FAD-binding FR-type domain-containing protein n=1 Tax=Aplosporella prunicola CBS 121167 TaxID=1176127 RepID=A0A6A6BD74_9PEZI|nr:uncharacterized protein K452DRAFT_249747 [Aplosporella prunicola CBS 121167]KAF2141996.1 hypothetical protein K452DRAFT_249747 [Aplosporella prunicola CBS 121167]